MYNNLAAYVQIVTASPVHSLLQVTPQSFGLAIPLLIWMLQVSVVLKGEIPFSSSAY